MTSTRQKRKKPARNTQGNHSGGLGIHVREVMDKYFRDLDGHPPAEVYELILSQIEIPLFESVLDYTGGNVTRAADILGLNRGTFRNRLRKYEMQ